MIGHRFSDASKFASGGIWSTETAADCLANFPALRNFWRVKETSGTTLTDIAGGRILTLTGALWDTANAVNPNLAGATAEGRSVTGGNLVIPQPATGNCIFLAVGKFNGTNHLQYGFGGTNGCVSLNQNAANSVNISGVTFLAGTAFTNGAGAVYGRANAVTWNGNQQNFESNSTTTSTALATVSTSAPNNVSAGLTAIDNSITLNNGTQQIYCMAYLAFTGALPPADFIKGMLAWMTYQASNGNKWMYPGLRGLS